MNSLFKKMKKDKKEKVKHAKKDSKIPFHYDDKGRRIFDFDKTNHNYLLQPTSPSPIQEVIIPKGSEVQEFIKPRGEADEKGIAISNIDSKVIAIDAKNPTSKDVFYCESCKCSFRDNLSYVDHINGKRHNLIIGQGLKVKQSTVESVREKLLQRKIQRNPQKKTEKEIEY